MNSINVGRHRKKMGKEDQREPGAGERRGEGFFLNGWLYTGKCRFSFFEMNEFCSIIDTGSHLSQSVRHLLFISPYLCCQIGLSYGSLKHEWYRWQESSQEIDNDEERCHIKSEGATVNIPAQRRIFLANTPLQGLFFFWLQMYSPPQKLAAPPSCWQESDTFALVSFVCQLILPLILNLYFPKVVEVLGGKRELGEGGGRQEAF